MAAGDKDSRNYRVIKYPMVVKRPREYMRVKRRGHAVTSVRQDIDGKLEVQPDGTQQYVSNVKVTKHVVRTLFKK